jgi:hypothetical protein
MTASVELPACPPAVSHEDAAWVRIPTALTAADLRAFLDDVERLYRINPLLEIATFEPMEESRYRLAADNHSNGRRLDAVLAVTATDFALEIAYSVGLKTATHFRVETTPGGTHLVVTDIYGRGSDEERRARADDVDLSLNAWGRALHDYLRAWVRWKWLGPWRWYMRRVWQPMKPSARRVVWIIWVISAFEMLALVALMVIWAVVRQVST